MTRAAMRWVKAWPARNAGWDAWKAWLDSAPLYHTVRGPSQEWASRQGADEWALSHFRNGGMRTAMGRMSTDELLTHWEPMSVAVEPHLATDTLRELVSHLPEEEKETSGPLSVEELATTMHVLFQLADRGERVPPRLQERVETLCARNDVVLPFLGALGEAFEDAAVHGGK